MGKQDFSGDKLWLEITSINLIRELQLQFAISKLLIKQNYNKMYAN